MAEASDKFGILRQNLIDAGCGDNTIKKCIDYAQSDEWDRLIPKLSEHKAALLGAVHENQKKIDCLDFLVYQIKKEHNKEEK